MSSDQNKLKFPSGRSVSSIKKDAKKLCRSENIQLSEALDRLAITNGIDETWAVAINSLKENYKP